MNIKAISIYTLVLVALIAFFGCYGGVPALGNPTTQPLIVHSRGDVSQWLQAILDTANAAGLKIQAIKAFYADGSTYTVNPVVVTTAPASQPTTQPTTQPATVPSIKKITLADNAWAYEIPPNSKASLDIHDLQVTGGGIIHALGGDTITMRNVTGVSGGKASGMYRVMLWPPPNRDGSQNAIPHFSATDCSFPQSAGLFECAVRGKCDDAQFTRCTFTGYLQPNGAPWKQVVEIRHGKSWSFTDCSFVNSWPDIGQQKVAGQGYVTSQHVGTVKFTRCTFTRWTDKKRGKVYSRQPGVDHVVFVDCINPDGKKFSKSE